MKGTELFKQIIKEHLDKKAQKDESFSRSYSKKGKNIDDCVTYILNQVKRSGCNGFDDSEIFGMAIHYYDEDDIKVGDPIDCKVVINHSTATENYSKRPSPKRSTKNNNVKQLSLFDL